MNSYLPERKNPRLENYDYSAPGAYFITICTKNKAKILCSFVGAGVLDRPETVFTDKGKIVDETLREMSNFYPHIQIEKYVVMPNHVHLLLNVLDVNGLSRPPAPTRCEGIENGLSRTPAPTGCEGVENGLSRTPAPTNAAVPSFISTLKRRVNRAIGENIWQRSYHDHVIRDEADYLRIWDYIDTNPIKWQDDCYYIAE